MRGLVCHPAPVRFRLEVREPHPGLRLAVLRVPGRWMRGMRARLEFVANCAVIALACVVGYAVLRTYVFRQQGSARPDAPTRSYDLQSLKGASSVGKQPTLVLALRQGCHYCEASAPFYRNLARREASGELRCRLLAILPDGGPAVSAFMRSEGLTIATLPDVALPPLGVQGTPTLLLVDAHGNVVESWVGELSDTQREGVIAAVSR